MATKLRHTITCPFPLTAYAAAISDPEYWARLAAGTPDAPGELESTEITDSAAEIRLIQRIPSEQLPSAVSGLISGDLSIKRLVNVRFTDAEHITGTFEAVVSGAPATVEGTIDATGTADETTVTFTAAVAVRIPLVGGKIEKMVVANLVELLGTERDFTVAWHDEHA